MNFKTQFPELNSQQLKALERIIFDEVKLTQLEMIAKIKALPHTTYATKEQINENERLVTTKHHFYNLVVPEVIELESTLINDKEIV